MRFAIANMYKNKKDFKIMNLKRNCNDCSNLFITHDLKEDGDVIILVLNQILYHLLK